MYSQRMPLQDYVFVLPFVNGLVKEMALKSSFFSLSSCQRNSYLFVMILENTGTDKIPRLVVPIRNCQQQAWCRTDSSTLLWLIPILNKIVKQGSCRDLQSIFYRLEKNSSCLKFWFATMVSQAPLILAMVEESSVRSSHAHSICCSR